MYNVSRMLNRLDRHEAALPFCKRALKLYEDTLGERHANTINAMDNLAVTFYLLARYEEALPIYEHVVALRKELFGDEDINTINDIHNLADTLSHLNRHEEARPLYKKISEFYERQS